MTGAVKLDLMACSDVCRRAEAMLRHTNALSSPWSVAPTITPPRGDKRSRRAERLPSMRPSVTAAATTAPVYTDSPQFIYDYSRNAMQQNNKLNKLQ